MIVDDERPCIDELKYMLMKHPDIGAYTDSLEALTAAKLSMPDIVFLDICMPDA